MTKHAWIAWLDRAGHKGRQLFAAVAEWLTRREDGRGGLHSPLVRIDGD